MLSNLHVKNLALLDETDVEFGRGLNILTGETGAGKSLLIGSVNLALGAKAPGDLIRKGADFALVELCFSQISQKARQLLINMELEDSEEVILSRKITETKSVFRINGESVTAKQVKELASELIDIHGQHEHQSLLKKSKQLEILDEFCGSELEKLKQDNAILYKEYVDLKKLLENEKSGANKSDKELALAEFELKEIEDAQLQLGEDETLEADFIRMSNSQKIQEALNESYNCLSGEEVEGASSLVSQALRSLKAVSSFDSKLDNLSGELLELDSILSDITREISGYMSDFEDDGQELMTVRERLNLINHLKSKYGKTIEAIIEYADNSKKMIDKFKDFDAYIIKLEDDLEKCTKKLDENCEKISKIRLNGSVELSKLLEETLVSLNFLSVKFKVSVTPGNSYSANGYDDVEFMISTNPGEDVKPISMVASGGELSRIMLAIKTIMAGRDDIDALIFDEVDAGISGKTAWRVAEELSKVSKYSQVICITHLAQIAAMAEKHFVIEKDADSGVTTTDVRRLSEDDSLKELARLLGSDELTDAALLNARDMKNKAYEFKLNNK